MRLKSDSFVVESNVHFPTDYNLLWDCARKCIGTVSRIMNKHKDIGGWRKIGNWRTELKKLMRNLGHANRSGGKNKKEKVVAAAEEYLNKSRLLLKKLNEEKSGFPLTDMGDLVLIITLEHYMELLEKHIDLVDRRILKGETIPHEEKMFSVFETYTEWITKGKMNPSVELGKKLTLYNGMIHPLVGYGIKGVIWCQGENNSGDAYRYRSLFPNMITDWRKQWGYEFPFLWVQLASFMALDDQPKDSEWAELREAQNMTLSLPKTGQAVITDIGEAFDIHPRNKKDVGLRLAHTAMNVAYQKNVLPSGPVFEEMKQDGNRMILSFSGTGEGLSTLDKNKYGYVNGFAIAGEDQKFVWAKAYLLNNQVVVFNDEVQRPVAVRYGWANNPIEINLINSDGLLASPFRTDQWKGLTERK